MKGEKQLRTRRIKAVRALLEKNPHLPEDMKKYWLGVLKALSAWSVELHNFKKAKK